MLSDRSREALDDLLVTWSWSTASDAAPPSSRPGVEILHELAREEAEAIAMWLCEERNLPAAMAEEIVSASRRASPR